MSDQSTLSALVAAWEAWDETGGLSFANAAKGRALKVVTEARHAFAEDHGLDSTFVRSEMLRLRRKRPQPDRAAVLVAIIEGTDQ